MFDDGLLALCGVSQFFSLLTFSLHIDACEMQRALSWVGKNNESTGMILSAYTRTKVILAQVELH